MSTKSVAEVRSHLAEAIASAADEPVVIERRGKRAAVLISPGTFDQMLAALEEAEDVAAYDEAMAETGDNISWEQAKADLGWA